MDTPSTSSSPSQVTNPLPQLPPSQPSSQPPQPQPKPEILPTPSSFDYLDVTYLPAIFPSLLLSFEYLTPDQLNFVYLSLKVTVLVSVVLFIVIWVGIDNVFDLALLNLVIHSILILILVPRVYQFSKTVYMYKYKNVYVLPVIHDLQLLPTLIITIITLLSSILSLISSIAAITWLSCVFLSNLLLILASIQEFIVSLTIFLLLKLVIDLTPSRKVPEKIVRHADYPWSSIIALAPLFIVNALRVVGTTVILVLFYDYDVDQINDICDGLLPCSTVFTPNESMLPTSTLFILDNLRKTLPLLTIINLFIYIIISYNALSTLESLPYPKHRSQNIMLRHLLLHTTIIFVLSIVFSIVVNVVSGDCIKVVLQLVSSPERTVLFTGWVVGRSWLVSGIHFKKGDPTNTPYSYSLFAREGGERRIDDWRGGRRQGGGGIRNVNLQRFLWFEPPVLNVPFNSASLFKLVNREHYEAERRGGGEGEDEGEDSIISMEESTKRANAGPYGPPLLLREQPIFIFSSCIKALYWSKLVYLPYDEDEEVLGGFLDAEGRLKFDAVSKIGEKFVEDDEGGVSRADSGSGSVGSGDAVNVEVEVEVELDGEEKKENDDIDDVKKQKKKDKAEKVKPEPQRMIKALPPAMSQYNLDSFVVIQSHLTDSKCVISWSSNNTRTGCNDIVVSFRGSKTLKNFKEDARFWKCELPRLKRMAESNAGAAEASAAVDAAAVAVVATGAEVQDVLENVIADVETDVHALGGAETEVKGWVGVVGGGASRSRLGGFLAGKPKFHTGFVKSWTSDNFDGRIIAKVRELFIFALENHSTIPVVRVSGHSLGGAIAVLCGFELSLELAQILKASPLISTLSEVDKSELLSNFVRVVTFGCPATSNVMACKIVSSQVPNIWNVVNNNDLVYYVGSNTSGLKHPGIPILVNSRGDMLVRPGSIEQSLRHFFWREKASDHKFSSYQSTMAAVLDRANEMGWFLKDGEDDGEAARFVREAVEELGEFCPTMNEYLAEEFKRIPHSEGYRFGDLTTGAVTGAGGGMLDGLNAVGGAVQGVVGDEIVRNVDAIGGIGGAVEEERLRTVELMGMGMEETKGGG